MRRWLSNRSSAMIVGLRKALLDISPTGLCLAADVTERVGDFRVSRMNLRGVRLHGFNRIKHRRQGIIFDTDQTQRLFSSCTGRLPRLRRLLRRCAAPCLYAKSQLIGRISSGRFHESVRDPQSVRPVIMAFTPGTRSAADVSIFSIRA